MNPYQKLEETIIAQEKALRLQHFTNQDALDLGNFVVACAKEQGLVIAVAVRKTTGAILFQHLMEGTTINNENWMRRKFNSVLCWEHSSLYAWAHERLTGDTLEDNGLTKADYAFCGGGFPLTMQNGELVGVLTVSALPHFDDHRFLVQSLAKWLGVADLPDAHEID